MDKFQCKKCGGCCRNIRGRLNQEKPAPILQPYLFQPVDRTRLTIGIFEWDLPSLREKAKKLSINLRVVPSLMAWDDLNQVSLVLQWMLDHDDCPFLPENNLCLINDSKPLACQNYPLFAYGFADQYGREPLKIELGDCPNKVELPFKKGPFQMKTQAVFRELQRRYRLPFLAMLRLDLASGVFPEVFGALVRDWKIYPAIIDNQIRENLAKNKPVGFLKYLETNHPDLYQQVLRRVKAIYELDYVHLKRLMASY